MLTKEASPRQAVAALPTPYRGDASCLRVTDGGRSRLSFSCKEAQVHAMHGEYKTPGGKLVRVEFEVADGVLRDAVVSGDFFLYPEEALEAITGSLQGLATELSEQEIAARVAAAMPAGTEWLGSSPEALAIAVRRALTPGEAAG